MFQPMPNSAARPRAKAGERDDGGAEDRQADDHAPHVADTLDRDPDRYHEREHADEVRGEHRERRLGAWPRHVMPWPTRASS